MRAVNDDQPSCIAVYDPPRSPFNFLSAPPTSPLPVLLFRAIRLGSATVLAWTALAANAHTDVVNAQGFQAGVLHPITGFDHLLAMVAVGIWGATLGAPLLWMLPLVFPLLMVAGGILGIAGVPVPFVEAGIALSVLLLGAAILAQWRAPTLVAVVLVAFFGVLHGHAHGTELPAAASPAAYSAGFVLSTGLLHLAGVGIGVLKQWRRGTLVLRAVGAAMAATGTWFLLAIARG